MKLFEVLTKTHPAIRSSSRPANLYPPPKKWGNDSMNGQQSVVYGNPNKSNKVIKVTAAFNGIEDPAYQFTRLILNHQDNPFFPRIYNVKQYPTYDEQLDLVIHQERLNHITAADIPKIKELFGISNENHTTNHTNDELSRIFNDPEFRRQIIRTTKNIQLKQALRLLEPLFRHYGPDMNLSNIMVRPSTGQYVLIDPITYGMY